MSVRIAPDILAADFTRLAEEAAAVEDDADLLHVDVMDNHFVPSLTVGLPVVRALADNVRLPLDLHLGITNVDHWATRYAESGAGGVTIHAEATRTPVRTLRAIRAAGARAGLAVNPATPLGPYEELLREADMLLVMTVEPGLGSRDLLDTMLAKVRHARALINAQVRYGSRELPLWLQVEGGVNEKTIEACAEAGADAFVAGSAVYGAADPGLAVRTLRQKAEAARRPASHAA
jgi:ribulose-phosphate 3-epimerase